MKTASHLQMTFGMNEQNNFQPRTSSKKQRILSPEVMVEEDLERDEDEEYMSDMVSELNFI